MEIQGFSRLLTASLATTRTLYSSSTSSSPRTCTEQGQKQQRGLAHVPKSAPHYCGNFKGHRALQSAADLASWQAAVRLRAVRAGKRQSSKGSQLLSCTLRRLRLARSKWPRSTRELGVSGRKMPLHSNSCQLSAAEVHKTPNMADWIVVHADSCMSATQAVCSMTRLRVMNRNLQLCLSLSRAVHTHHLPQD